MSCMFLSMMSHERKTAKCKIKHIVSIEKENKQLVTLYDFGTKLNIKVISDSLKDCTAN